MSGVTVGDLAQHFLLRRQNASLQTELNNRVRELSTNEVHDVNRHLSGNFTVLSGIQRSLELNTSFATVLTSAKTFFDGQAAALEKARGSVSNTGIALIDAAQSVDQTRRSAVLADARTSFDAVMAALSTQTGGRTLFAGAATQSAAFAAPQAILNDFAATLGSATTAADVMTAADAYFAPGGGYDGAAYTGSFTQLTGYKVTESAVIGSDLSGDSSEIRDLIKLHAVAAVVADGSVTLIEAEKSNLMSDVGQQMKNLDTDLIGTQARLGTVQQRIERYQTENTAESYMLQAARKDLIGTDTAETAMRLTEVQAQLEAMYTVTARLSHLSLTEYL